MIKQKACIINFSTNNLLSIERAISFLGYETRIINEKENISSYDIIVLPGVGTFNQVMNNLKKTKLLDVIEQALIKKKN